jgi:transposase
LLTAPATIPALRASSVSPILAVGRKNFLFAGHPDGGHNFALLQSLCSTGLLRGVNPHEYLKDVAVGVRTHPASRIDELLPCNCKPLDHVEAA